MDGNVHLYSCGPEIHFFGKFGQKMIIVYFLPWCVKSRFKVINISKSYCFVLHYKLQEKFNSIHSINCKVDNIPNNLIFLFNVGPEFFFAMLGKFGQCLFGQYYQKNNRSNKKIAEKSCCSVDNTLSFPVQCSLESLGH